MYSPEMPQNVGNIGRTCVLTGSKLHLIKPYMFDLSNRSVKRAGMDYWQHLNLEIHGDIYDFLEKYGNEKIFLSTTKGSMPYTEAKFEDECFIIFGKESSGLPDFLHEKYPDTRIKVPMIDTTARSNGIMTFIVVFTVLLIGDSSFTNFLRVAISVF